MTDDVRPGERDPRRPPGLPLVVIAAAVLVTFVYVMFPHHEQVQAPPAAGTSPSASPAGK